MPVLQDYRSRPHWSYSSLNQFLNVCSLQWAFERIYKVPKPFTPVALSFGSAFHRTLEWVHLLKKQGEQAGEQETRDLFRDLWGRQVEEDSNIRFEEDEDADALAAKGADVVASFLRGIDPEERVVALNEAFAVPLVDAEGVSLEKPLIGEMDCIVEKGGRRTVVDWKTSGRRWAEGQAARSLQPTVYLYAFEQIHGEPAPFRFDIVVKGKTPSFEQHATTRGPDAYERMIELVRLAEDMVAHEHFVPNEQSFYCSSCPFAGACASWHRRSPSPIRMAA